jgi:hypothetical protein
MTITLDRRPSSAPVDFDSLAPFEAMDATTITDVTSPTTVEGGSVRRPGDIGSVAMKRRSERAAACQPPSCEWIRR